MKTNRDELIARFRRAKERKKVSVEKTKQILATEYIKMYPNVNTLHFEFA